MDVKASTKEAKQASFMTLVYYNLVYMVFYRLVTIKDSMITKEFSEKLATAKNDAHLDKIVEEIIKDQFPNPIKQEWVMPDLQGMETELMHLISFWNDRKVIHIIFSQSFEHNLTKNSSVRIPRSFPSIALQLCS